MHATTWINPVVGLCKQAGAAILAVYQTNFDVEQKSDHSPLTRADLASNRVLTDGLTALTPSIPIISEEAGLPEFSVRREWQTYWLIDPLDGTREFVNRNDEFTVNVALVRDGQPVLGVVYVPVTGTTYVGCENHGADRRAADGSVEPIHVAASSAAPVRILGSRSHRGDSLNAYLERIGDVELKPVGSSLKFCYVAEGSADIYPRLGPTSEWDTAAAQAVVEQAGGAVLELDGSPLSYNHKENILNPHFLVIGPRDRDWVGMAEGV